MAEDFYLPLPSLDDENACEDTEPSAIIEEVVEMRDCEFVRHYRHEDGSYTTAFFSQPVQFQDEHGTWQDIDNTLELQSDGTLAPAASGLDISVPQYFSNEQLLTIGYDGYSVGFGLIDMDASVAQRSQHRRGRARNMDELEQSRGGNRGQARNRREQVEFHNTDMMEVDNLAAVVEFADVLPGVDVEHVVGSNSVSEQIIIHETQEEYTYYFQLNLEGLLAVPQDNGEIVLYRESDSSEPLFVLQAPVMFDATGEMSDAFDVVLLDGMLAISANANWINAPERMLPVTIVPMNVQARSVAPQNNREISVNDSPGSNSNLFAGMGSGLLGIGDGNRNRTYMRFCLCTCVIPANHQITHATLSLRQYNTQAWQSGTRLHVYEVLDAWTNSLNWAGSQRLRVGPRLDRSDEIRNINTFNHDWHHLNVTAAVSRWQNGESTNHGFRITTNDENRRTRVQLNSTNNINSNLHPSLTVEHAPPRIGMSEWSVNNHGGTSPSIDVHAGGSWTVSAPDWLTVSRTNGGFTLTAAENTRSATNEGDVIVRGANNVEIGRVTVMQLGATPGLLVSHTNWSSHVDGSSQRVEIVSNVDWTITVPQAYRSWLSVSRASGSNNNHFTITARANNGNAIRHGTITVQGGGMTRTITVTLHDRLSTWFSQPSNVYNHALATWLFQVAYHAYFPRTNCPRHSVNQYPSCRDCHNAPWWSTLPANSDIYSILVESGFAREHIRRENTRTVDTTQHTFAHRMVTVADGHSSASAQTTNINNTIGGLNYATVLAGDSNDYFNPLIGYSSPLSNPSRADSIFGDDLLLVGAEQYTANTTSASAQTTNINNTIGGLNYVRNSLYNSNDYSSPLRSSSRTDNVFDSLVELVGESNNVRPLVMIAMRGSGGRDWPEVNWPTQLPFLLLFPGRTTFADQVPMVINNLDRYLRDHNLVNPIIVITGHSHGAAVGNILAAELNGRFGSENVFAYTFATPNAQVNILPSPHTNIFNILNQNDVVTFAPLNLAGDIIGPMFGRTEVWGRHGIDFAIEMPIDFSRVPFLNWTPSHSFPHGLIGGVGHSPFAYQDWLRSHDDLSQHQIQAMSDNSRARGVLPLFFSWKCPVDIVLFDSMNRPVAQIVDAEVREIDMRGRSANDGPVPLAWVTEDGEKNLFIPHGADISHASVVARDHGTMQFAAARLDPASSTPHEASAFDNISLHPGREFVMNLDADIADITVHIVENGRVIGEVLQDGTEIIFSEGQVVNSWDALRTAINAAPAGVPTLILLDRNLQASGTITIPANRQIILASNNNTNRRVITQTSGRHFTVNGSLMLRQGITLRAGGVDVRAGGQLTMTSGSIVENGNHATGGAVSLVGSGTAASTRATFSMTGGTIRNNTAENGGGVNIGTNSRMVMTGGTIAGNTTTNDVNVLSHGGGGVRLSTATSVFELLGGTIENNRSARRGGGVHIGIDGAAFMMHSGTIRGNTAAQQGGGVGIASSTANHATLLITGGSIENNTAASGGGVGTAGTTSTQFGPQLTISGGRIDNNTATSGGGVQLGAAARLTMTGGTISNNSATNGGGVNLLGGSAAGAARTELILQSGTIMSNEAATGGGVRVTANAHMNMTGGMVSNNTASTAGGGVALVGTGTAANTRATFTLTDGIVRDNQAGDGGGVNLGINSHMTMTNGTIASNTTTSTANNINAGGGGVRLREACAVFNFNGGTIESNHSARHGGGVLVSRAAQFTMNNGAIRDNTATNDGGGVMVATLGTTRTPFNLRGGTIEHNTATNGGGIATMRDSGATTGSLITMTGGTIRNNTARTAGGGAHITAGATLTMNGANARIENNHATSTIATNGGGGVNLAGSGIDTSGRAILTLTNGTISGNTADQSGGGVRVAANARLNMTGGSIDGNRSFATAATGGGGGVFVSTAGNTNDGIGLNMSGGTISNNNAQNGGGVFTNDQASFLNLHIRSNAIFFGNTARSGASAPRNTRTTRVAAAAFSAWDCALNNDDVSFRHPSGLVPVEVRSWVELRNAINAAPANTPVTIHLTASFTAPTGANGNAITIPANRRIMLTSSTAANTRVLTQPNSGQRHFIVEGSLVLGNRVTLRGGTDQTINRGGVLVRNSGRLTMHAGSIIENNRASQGGGVRVETNGLFTMNDGAIRNNVTTGNGGGVSLVTDSRFVMRNGTIYNNTAISSGGGGVRLTDTTTFTMFGGTIRNNTANTSGGISRTAGAVFNHLGGEVRNNTPN